ncbi:hypothetical protein DVH24_000505 [Malus domestica]|uniref:Uncharacterized protein n=1 Tax=Malus domestica TaxID=3750 RepID=A0A498J0W6_MALDO|nr:hypothetical protein DVH24_000505 [Malus domestica]
MKTNENDLKTLSFNDKDKIKGKVNSTRIDFLVPTFVKIIKQKSVGEFKPDPCIATLLNSALWSFYGCPNVHPDSLLVLKINGTGLVIELIYIAIFLAYSPGRRRISNTIK